MKLIALMASLALACSVHAQQSLETLIQKGHELAVVAVAISPDSNFVATGSKDKSIKLWDLRNGREVRNFLGHQATVSALQFSADGRWLVSGSRDNTVRGWDVLSGKEIFTISAPEETFITAIAIDPGMKFFATAGYGRTYGDTVYVYDFKTRRKLAALPANPDKGLGYGVDVVISPDGKWMGLGEDNRVATVFNTQDWKKVYQFDFTEGWCGGCGTKLTFSPDSRTVYMASHNGPVKKYSLHDGKLLHVYEEKPDELSGLAISPNGRWLARATEENVVVWDEASGQEITRLDAEEQGLFHSVAFTLDSKKLIITSDNNTAFEWVVAHKKKGTVLTGLLNQRDKGGLNYDANFVWQSAIARYVRFKNQVLITKDGKELIKGKFGTKVKRWDIASGQTTMEYGGHKKAVLCYDLSQDGKYLLTGGGDGKVILWNVQSGDSLKVFQPHREPIFDIQFSNDETMFACSSWDATMRVYDLNTGKTIHYWDFSNKSVFNLQFHPNDLYLFTAQLDFSLQMYELDTREPVRNFIGHTDVISSLRVSPDQKMLVSSSWDGSIRLWDIATGLMVRKFRDHQGAVHIAVFSTDGNYIYSAGADRVIRVWETVTGKLVRKLDGHQAEVTSLAFSPDNKMLISHSVDGTTKFWDLTRNKEFFEHIHLGEHEWMAKTPDGYFNGTQGARQYIHFVSGMKTYAVDQFFEDFYRPDLLPKLFQNRGGSAYQDLQGKLNSAPPPSVKVASLTTDNPEKIEVFVRITDMGGGVESLRLYHNGKSIPVDKSSLTLPSGKGQFTTYKQSIHLVHGENTIGAVATNKSRVESDVQSITVQSNAAFRNSTCYVLAVGINQYKNPRLSLNYARPDAESFMRIIDEQSKTLFDNIVLHTLFDDQASKGNILRKLEDLAGQVQPQDVFIFYYAGHGSMVDNRFFFIPTEGARLYDLSALQSEALEASVLQEKFKSIKALKQLIVMDACQSGASVELLAARGAAEEKAIAQLSRSAGIHVMASAGSEQFATEFTELGHGLFTYLLIEALGGAADGAPKDGKVTIYELKSYLDDQVPEMTRRLKGKPQYPYTFSRGQDFPIILPKD
jgi:WD40 repeat protein